MVLPASRWFLVVCTAVALATRDSIMADSMRAVDCNKAAIQAGDCDPFSAPSHASALKAEYSSNETRLNAEELARQKKSDVRECSIMTTLLLGFIVVDVAILYLLNSTDPQVQAYSFKMLSSSIVVFNAQTITNICENCLGWMLSVCNVKNTLKMWLGMRKKPLKMWLLSFMFFPWFFSISLLAFLLRERHDDLFAAVSLVAHVGAFSALEGLGELQELLGEKLVTNLKGTGLCHSATFCLYLVGPLAVLMSYQACSFLSHLWRECQAKRCATADQATLRADVLSHGSGLTDAPATPSEGMAERPSGGHLADAPTSPSEGKLAGHHLTDASVTPSERDSHTDHGHDNSHWKHEAFVAESEAASIFTGFFVKQFFVYVVTGHPPPMDCKDDPIRCTVSAFQMYLLAAVAVGLYSVVVVISIYHTYLAKTSKVLLRLQLLFSMSFSWTLMHLGDMVVAYNVMVYIDSASVLHSVTAKKLAAAAMMSPLFIFVILILDKLADHGKMDDDTAEATVQCIALLIGFYWEKVFGNAVHNVAKYSNKSLHSMLFVITIELGLILFILPAWRWYVVHKANQPVPKRKTVA